MSNYPDMRNPRHVRALMHNAYDRYVHGEDMFPKVKLLGPEHFPARSRQIAAVLFREWQVIDDDRAYFDAILFRAVDFIKQRPDGGIATLHSRVGRNAVNFAFVEPGDPVRVITGIQDSSSFVEQVEGKSYQLSDGRIVEFANGSVQPGSDPDVTIYRRSGAANLYLSQPEAAAA